MTKTPNTFPAIPKELIGKFCVVARNRLFKIIKCITQDRTGSFQNRCDSCRVADKIVAEYKRRESAGVSMLCGICGHVIPPGSLVYLGTFNGEQRFEHEECRGNKARQDAEKERAELLPFLPKEVLNSRDISLDDLRDAAKHRFIVINATRNREYGIVCFDDIERARAHLAEGGVDDSGWEPVSFYADGKRVLWATVKKCFFDFEEGYEP